MKTSRHCSTGEETKSHCNLEQKGGFYSNSRHLTYVLPLLLKSEIGEMWLVLRKERWEKMKIRHGRRRRSDRAKEKERKQIEIRLRKGSGVGDEQGKIDGGEGLEITN